MGSDIKTSVVRLLVMDIYSVSGGEGRGMLCLEEKTSESFSAFEDDMKDPDLTEGSTDPWIVNNDSTLVHHCSNGSFDTKKNTSQPSNDCSIDTEVGIVKWDIKAVHAKTLPESKTRPANDTDSIHPKELQFLFRGLTVAEVDEDEDDWHGPPKSPHQHAQLPENKSDRKRSDQGKWETLEERYPIEPAEKNTTTTFGKDSEQFLCANAEEVKEDCERDSDAEYDTSEHWDDGEEWYLLEETDEESEDSWENSLDNPDDTQDPQ